MVVDGWLHDKITASWLKKTGRNPTDRGKQGVKRSLMTDANGLPLALVVSGANTHDIKLVEDTLDALQTGRPGYRLRLCMDKGYEAEWLENSLKARRYEPHVQSRKEESEAHKNSDFKAHRWVVERTHSWMNRFRRVLTRWEKKAENYEAMLHFGFCRIKKPSGNMLFFLQCYLPMSLIRIAFKRLHYPVDIIAQCVRWYLAYSLSLRDLEEMMAERGIHVDHSTLHRWVIRLVPPLDKAFRRHKRHPGRRWKMDETYIKIRGQWKYLYRAVDSMGQTIDFLLTAKRDASAALRFFRKAIRHHGEPEVVTVDKSGANTAALATLNADKPDEETISIRQSKYLNNRVEQDHRNIKRRIRPMLGFKSFRRAQTILAGIELIHMIRKGQYQHPAGDGMSPAEQFYLLAA